MPSAYLLSGPRPRPGPAGLRSATRGSSDLTYLLYHPENISQQELNIPTVDLVGLKMVGLSAYFARFTRSVRPSGYGRSIDHIGHGDSQTSAEGVHVL